jgi:aspartyl/asparaginyl beta-hydroxylase (cupin superfamily)
MLSKDSLQYKIKKKSGIFLIRIVERIFSFFDNRIWIDKEEFEYTKVLEANAEAIRAEFLAIQQNISNINELFPESNVNFNDENWKTFFLIVYGHNLKEHMDACPVTTMCLSQIPFATTAMFSVLEPHKTIPLHRGEYKGVLRCHLGVIVPEPDKCAIVIQDKTYRWEEGKCIYFDDTFPHYAVNDSDQRRVVLFIDILRPYPFPVNYLNYVLFKQISKSEFIQEVLVRSKSFDGVRSVERKLNYL